MNVDIAKLEAAVEDLKGVLKDGLMAVDIWDRSTGLSLASFNAQPAAVALFTQVTNDMSGALGAAGFPSLNRYYMIDLEGDATVLIVRHGADLLAGMLLNNKKANLGILLSVALPRTLDMVAKAKG